MIDKNIDILCIAETKLDPSRPTGSLSIPGYRLPYRCDVNGRSGGLLVYVNESIPSKELNKFTISNKDFQILPIEINFRKSKWLLLSIYKHPGYNITNFNENLGKIIDVNLSCYDNYVVLGDFNTETTNIYLENFIENYSLYNLIKTPTCFKSAAGKCIDLILTNRKHNFMKSQTFETGLSDHHHLIYTIFKTNFTNLPPKKIKYRCYKKFDHDLFRNDLSIRLDNISQGNYDSFENTFQAVLNFHAPLKTKFVRGNDKPFMTKELRKAISSRSRLKNVANKTSDPNDIRKYKIQRNLVKNLNNKIKTEYYKNLNPKKLEMGKKFFTTFKPFFSSKYSPVERLLLIENDNIISSDATIANIMNEYFANITSNLNIMKWPDANYSPDSDRVTRAIGKYANHPSIIKIKNYYHIDTKFDFTHISPNYVHEHIKRLNINKSSSGPIHAKLLKQYIDLCYIPISNCINNSIDFSVFPNTLKLADISPIFKKEDKANKKNYRPISVLSCPSKIYERIYADQLNIYMADFLSPLLCGFRKSHSTQDALMHLIEKWRNALSTGNYVGTILFDLSKAFDTLPHDLIIAKLEAYGLSDKSLELIYDYLTCRKQRCKVGSTYSGWLDMVIGVPQGSVLGPLLFNIFLNDIFLFISESDICNFADDTTLYAIGKTIDQVIYKLEIDSKISISWLNNNSLVPNPDKFQLMFLGTRNKIDLCLNINGALCRSTQNINLLGMNIDWKLNFSDHIKHICQIANNKINALMKLRFKLSQDQKIILYHSFINSCFGYCNLLWMYCGKVANKMLIRAQKRGLQAVYNDFDSDYQTLLSKGSFKSIQERNNIHLLTHVFKVLNNESTPLHQNMYALKNNAYNLRISNLLTLPQYKTKVGLNSLRYRGSHLWNNLSDEIKIAPNSLVFKEKLNKIYTICDCNICLL